MRFAPIATWRKSLRSRTIAGDPGVLPDRLIYKTQVARGKGTYVSHLGRLLAQRNSFEGVICAHIHLLPLAALAARRCGTAHHDSAWHRSMAAAADLRCAAQPSVGEHVRFRE